MNKMNIMIHKILIKIEDYNSNNNKIKMMMSNMMNH